MPYVNKYRVGVLLTALSIAALVLGKHPANAQGLDLTAAEKTPAKCDTLVRVSDLARYKAPKAKKPYHLELSVPLFIPYMQALVYGAELAAKDAGVTLTTDAGKGFLDPAAQIIQIENALTHHPDAVLINPSDPDGMTPTIDQIIARGTPVFDVGTLSNSQKSIKVVQDDYRHGLMAAEVVAKLLPQGGQGILMGGPPNASWARRRVAGFLDGIKKRPNLKVLAVVSSDNSASDGLTKFTNAAEANPNFDFIYVTGSFILQPQSIPAEYRKAVYVAGSLTPVTLAALKNGIAAAILPDFPISVGYIGVSLAVHKLNGDSIVQYTCAPNGAVFRADANDPIWSETSIMPADRSATK